MKTIVHQPVLNELVIQDGDMEAFITEAIEVIVTDGELMDSEEVYVYVGDSEYCGCQPENSCNCLHEQCPICKPVMDWEAAAMDNLHILLDGWHVKGITAEPGNPCAVSRYGKDCIIVEHGDD